MGTQVCVCVFIGEFGKGGEILPFLRLVAEKKIERFVELQIIVVVVNVGVDNVCGEVRGALQGSRDGIVKSRSAEAGNRAISSVAPRTL